MFQVWLKTHIGGATFLWGDHCHKEVISVPSSQFDNDGNMSFSNYSVLFVDDEDDIIMALKRELRSEPYTRLFAKSGNEAAAIIADQSVQVVVTDMRMPEMTGLELLQFVETHHPQVIRIVLSAWSDADTIVGAVNKGHVFQYIIKPWDDRALKITIQQALDNYILKQEKRVLLDKLEEQNRLLEQRIEQRTQQVLKMSSQAEIGKHASQIVHNLNNPLHALGGALALADLMMTQDERCDLTKVAAKIALARNSAADLQRIISSILQHARDETRFQTATINLNAIIEQELTFFDLNPFFRKEIEKEIHLAENLPAVLGNAVQVKQIIDNLISNAVDAMEHSPIKRLTIRTIPGNGKVVIEVSDTGEGIAQQDLPYIFAPDFTTKPPGKGTGLGLASVMAMVEAYSGKIQVHSQKDKGTDFIVRLPAYGRKQV
jgi:signal transduction histidine kinase